MRLLGRYLSGQYRRPSGIVGRYIGGLMVKQHAPENHWTVDLLQAPMAPTFTVYRLVAIT